MLSIILPCYRVKYLPFNSKFSNFHFFLRLTFVWIVLSAGDYVCGNRGVATFLSARGDKHNGRPERKLGTLKSRNHLLTCLLLGSVIWNAFNVKD